MKRIDMSNTKHQQNLRAKAQARADRLAFADRCLLEILNASHSNIGANQWTAEKHATQAMKYTAAVMVERDKLTAGGGCQ